MHFSGFLPYGHCHGAEVRYPDTGSFLSLNAVHFRYVLLHIFEAPGTSVRSLRYLKATTAAYSCHTSVPGFCIFFLPAV